MFSKIKKETLRKFKSNSHGVSSSSAPQFAVGEDIIPIPQGNEIYVESTKYKLFEIKGESPSRFYSISPSNAVKLPQGMATLISNPQGGDVQFEIGGDIISIAQENDDTYIESARYKVFEKKGGAPSQPCIISPSSAAKLSQDMAILVNNPKGSDVQFKVGGGDIPLSTVTLYAHSHILRCRSRYFDTMLDEDKNWKESSKGVIHKPNISPSTFLDVLYYIYTGCVRTKDLQTIIELVTAADEMDLEGLSIECQNELIRTAKYFLQDNDEDDSDDNGEVDKELARQHIPIDVAINTHIIPALNFASSYSLSHLSQKLQEVIISYMSTINKSPSAYSAFVDKISSEDLAKIIASDNLEMEECSVWDLALDWACHQTKLSKTAVETRLSSAEDEEDDDKKSLDGTNISSSQLNQLKTTLTPLLPAIRFSLFDPDEYTHMAYTISYFLPRRRSVEIQQHFIRADSTRKLDAPRMADRRLAIPSKIISNYTAWKVLRKNIFETGGMVGCTSLYYLKFELLFRASKDGFHATDFHQRCDNKGPTLTVIKSATGYIFGGVNFSHWKTDNTWSSNPLNFLFTLPDGLHRKNSAIFKMKEDRTQNSAYNHGSFGPVFGGGNNFQYDLSISDSASTNYNSVSNLPNSYDGSQASNTTLAGARTFMVSDYEVFAISKN